MRIKINSYVKIFKCMLKSYYYYFDLKCIQNNTKNIKKKDIIAFVTLRNEAFRIQYFLKYYRQLGIKHFCFVDNNSTDNFLELIREEKDCSAWYTKASYKKSNFGAA